jgi:hypothetical protein
MMAENAEAKRAQEIVKSQGGLHAADQFTAAAPPPLKGAKPVGK